MPSTSSSVATSQSSNAWSPVTGNSVSSTSRPLTAADNGSTIEVDANVTFTIPAALPDDFGCAFLLLAGVTLTLNSDGNSLLNGATTAITRAQSSNVMFAIQQFHGNRLNYAVTGS